MIDLYGLVEFLVKENLCSIRLLKVFLFVFLFCFLNLCGVIELYKFW